MSNNQVEQKSTEDVIRELEDEVSTLGYRLLKTQDRLNALNDTHNKVVGTVLKSLDIEQAESLDEISGLIIKHREAYEETHEDKKTEKPAPKKDK